MNRKPRLLLTLFAFAIAAACGGDTVEEAVPDPMPEPEAETAAEPATSTPEMLGGGKATEVHPGQGGSPHVQVDWMIDEANVSISYGRRT